MNHSISEQYQWLRERQKFNFSLRQIKEINRYGSIWQFLRFLKPEILQHLSKIALSHSEKDMFNNAFCPSQIKSKLWLIRELNELGLPKTKVWVGCAWYNLLTYLLLELATFEIETIYTYDIDENCKEISNMMLKHAVNVFVCLRDVFSNDYFHLYDLFINTSCEHINFEEWLRLIPKGKMVALQSNDYDELEEHTNCCYSLEEFVERCSLSELYSCGVGKYTEKYERYMVIGRK